jgi:hypothetical protein
MNPVIQKRRISILYTDDFVLLQKTKSGFNRHWPCYLITVSDNGFPFNYAKPKPLFLFVFIFVVLGLEVRASLARQALCHVWHFSSSFACLVHFEVVFHVFAWVGLGPQSFYLHLLSS